MTGRRIFAAINISDEAKQKVSAYIAGLRSEFNTLRVGWERPEKLHITVNFAGNLDERALDKFVKTAEAAAGPCPAFPVTLAGTGAFVKRRGSNVLWLGIDAEPIAGIAARFETASAKADERPTRSFNPHLTIARLREPQNSRPLIDRHLASKFEPVEFEAAELVVYESELLPTGSVYRVITRHHLGVAKK